MKGRIFVIAGPSGVGKDTIMEILIKKLPNLVKAISYTDRLKRADDKLHTYRFISKEEFDEYLKTGEIFEWEYARDNINRYGSSKKEFDMLLKKGVNIIKIVGPKSFVNFRKIFGDRAIGIFIKYESLDELKPRLKRSRPDINKEEIEKRYCQAVKDMGYEKDYNYSVFNPEGHPESAAERIKQIIKENNA